MQDTPNKTLQHTTLNDDISPTMLSQEEKRELKERIQQAIYRIKNK